MQVFLIVLIVVMGLLLLGVNVYLLRNYLHPEDKKALRAPYAKIVVILGLTFCQAQALLIPLDVANNSTILSQSIDMHLVWLVFYLILFVFLCVFIPYSIFFYESDPEKSMFQRLCRAFLYLILAMIVPAFAIMINMIQSTKLRQVHPDDYTELIYYHTNDTVESSTANYGQFHAIQPLAVIQLLTFVGWFFVVFFAGVGLFALPMDFINEFRFRPKVRKSDQMRVTRNRIAQEVKKLIKQGQQLKDFDKEYQRNEQASCFEKFRGKRKANSKFTKFKVKYYALSETFSIFNLQLKLADTNPIIPFLKLFIGIIFLITSILWVIQIVFVNIAKNPLLPNRSLIYGLDNLFVWFDKRGANLFSTVLYAYFCLYMMWCVQKGSIKLGIRLPFCCRFYPMKQNETAMNGMLMNCVYLLLGSVGVTQLCIACFPQYTRHAEAYIIFQQFISNMGFYRVFYRYYLFSVALIGWTALSLIFLLITCNKKPAYMQQIDNIRRYHEQQLQRLQ